MAYFVILYLRVMACIRKGASVFDKQNAKQTHKHTILDFSKEVAK